MLRNFFVYNILFTFNIITKIDPKGSRAFVAGVAIVSVRGIFLLFGGAKIGTSATLMEGAGRGKEGGGKKRKRVSFPPFPPPSRTFLRSPQFLRVQKAKNMLQTCGKPDTTETLATQARAFKKSSSKMYYIFTAAATVHSILCLILGH